MILVSWIECKYNCTIRCKIKLQSNKIIIYNRQIFKRTMKNSLREWEIPKKYKKMKMTLFFKIFIKKTWAVIYNLKNKYSWQTKKSIHLLYSIKDSIKKSIKIKWINLFSKEFKGIKKSLNNRNSLLNQLKIKSILFKLRKTNFTIISIIWKKNNLIRSKFKNKMLIKVKFFHKHLELSIK